MKLKYKPTVVPLGITDHLKFQEDIFSNCREEIKNQENSFEAYLKKTAFPTYLNFKHRYCGIDGQPISHGQYMALIGTYGFNVIAQGHYGKCFISTIFLSLNHNFCYPETNIPIIFETMAFVNDDVVYQERYSTYQQAVDGHQTAIDYVKDNYTTLFTDCPC